MIAAILAGGRSRRMGSDKALVDFGGEPLIARPIAAARDEPFPGRYEPSEILVEALRLQAPLRATPARLHPVELEVDPQVVASLNTPEELARWT